MSVRLITGKGPEPHGKATPAPGERGKTKMVGIIDHVMLWLYYASGIVFHVLGICLLNAHSILL